MSCKVWLTDRFAAHHLTAAEALDKATIDRLKKSIDTAKISKEYTTLNVVNKVQPDLLGGLIIDFGDAKTIDLSVKSRVQKLESLISRELRFSPRHIAWTSF